MKKRVFVAWLLAAALLAVLCGYSLADAGNFGGGSDYGGGGGSSWSDDGGSSWSGSSDYSSSGSGEGVPLPMGLVVAIIVVVVVFSVIKKGKGGNVGTSGSSIPARATPFGIAKLREKDPAFSEADFLKRVGNNYMQLQDAWEHKNWEPMRGVLSEDLYNQMARQLQELIDNGQTNKMERIAVLNSAITGYAQDAEHDILTVRLETRLIDYTVNDNTGALVPGTQKKELFMTYEWTMMRSKTLSTQPADRVTELHCSSCGAPIDIKQSAKCEYCGAIITVAEYDWMLTQIRGISQRSTVMK